MSETKPKAADSLRTPKPKKKLGLSVPPALRMPHDDLIHAETETPTIPSQTTMTSQTRHTTPTEEEAPVSPTRDFTKVANSIVRDAVPAGLFAGKSKQLYDCLYALTRGAVVPTRSIRISRPKLMKRARIGARVTFDSNVERLVAVGLIEVKTIAGEHDGNEYTIRTPDEISMPSQTSLTSLTDYAQKLVRLVRLETSQTRHTSSPVKSTTYTPPKTSFKTDEEIDDDEAFGPLAKTLANAAREVTGKPAAPADAARWDELAQLLATELKLAAARTQVSSAPAFLTEHLRRRLWKKEKRELDRELKEGATDAAAAVALVDAKECPDCRGTGLWYPAGNTAEGLAKGVAKCQHQKLVNPPQDTPPEP